MGPEMLIDERNLPAMLIDERNSPAVLIDERNFPEIQAAGILKNEMQEEVDETEPDTTRILKEEIQDDEGDKCIPAPPANPKIQEEGGDDLENTYEG